MKPLELLLGIVLLIFAVFSLLGADAATLTVMTTDVFGASSIPASALWDGGLNLTIRSNTSCVWNISGFTPRFLALATILEQSTAAPNGWTAFSSILVPVSINAFRVANYTSFSVGAFSMFSFILQPAVGFSIASPIQIKYVMNSTVSNCSTSVNTLMINPVAGGGFATVTLNVSQEFDIQRSGLQLDIALQYNLFTAAASSAVTVTSSTLFFGTSSWTFSLVGGNALLRGIHAAEPTFDLAAGTTATITVSFPALPTFLGSPPTPSSATFVINAVDGNPVAFCQLSSLNITDQVMRNGVGVISITLSPSSADKFVVSASAAAAAWGTTISSSQLPPSVSVVYSVRSPSEAILNFSAPSTFYVNTQSSVIFTPPPAILQSTTAGCGTLRLQIVPARGIASSDPRDAIAETYVNQNAIWVRFQVAFAEFLPAGTSLPVTFSSNYSRTGTSIETPFADALVLDKVSLSAVSLSSTEANVSFPMVPSYNIDVNRTECITILFQAGAMRSGVAPTTPLATVCITGQVASIRVRFASTNDSYTNATTLWDRGDTMEVALSGAVWNTTAVWFAGSPNIQSTNNSLQVLGFSAVNFSGVVFSASNRSAFVPFVACRGLSLAPNETGLITSFSRLLDNPSSVAVTSISFGLSIASKDSVTFNCSGSCAMSDSDSSVSESAVRTGFGFTVSVIYDILVDAATLNSIAWSIFTRNSSTFVKTPPTITVNKINSYTALFSVSSLPDFDITTQELSVLYLNSSFLKNRAVQANPRGYLIFKPNLPQPACSLVNITPAISEISVQTSNISMVLSTSLPFTSTVCSMLQNKTRILSYQTLLGVPLIVIVGNCTQFNAAKGILPFTLLSNSSYLISSSDVLTLLMDRSYFLVGERCAIDPEVVIPVIPAVAKFQYSYVPLPLTTPVPVPYDLTTTLPAAQVSERTLRAYGLDILIDFSGELLLNCSFFLKYTMLSVDATRSTGFTGFINSVWMTNASSCEVNRSTSVTFRGRIPPLYLFDISANETVSFYIDVGLGSGGTQPSCVNSNVTLYAQPEEATAVMSFNDTRVSMRPLAPLNLSGLILGAPSNGSQASWKFVLAQIAAEDLSQGVVNITFVLTGDRWSIAAARSIQDSLTTLNANFTVSNNVPQSTLLQLFDRNTATTTYNNSTRISRLTFFGSRVPSFYLTEDMFFQFTIPSDAVDSGITPVPGWMGLNVTSGPPILVPSGPAYRGGTRRLLLGYLYLIVVLQNDNFIKDSLSGPVICPTEFSACSVTVDASLRTLNISLPPQNIVIYTTTTYSINITENNMQTGRRVNNSVSFQLDVESGILRRISLGSQPVDGTTVIDESMWRTGSIPSIFFVLDGDSFVTDPVSVIAALKQKTTCSPLSDAYGFCARLSSLLVGTVLTLDRSQQISITLQADPLFDIAVDQQVTLAFGGVATTSTFPPVFLQDLSFTIAASNGTIMVATSFPTTFTQPIPAQDVRLNARTIVWTFTLQSERWNVGSTTPYYATPSGLAMQPLVLNAFSGSGACATCFNNRKKFLFANDVSVSSDLRTLRLAMTADDNYDTSQLENVTIQFTSEDLFLSSLLPVPSKATVRSMFIAPSGFRVFISSLSPSSITSSQNTSGFVDIFTTQEVLTRSGINITVTMADDNLLVWNRTLVLNGTATFTSQFTSSLVSPAKEPRGYAVVGQATAYAQPSPPGGGNKSLVLSIPPLLTNRYSLQTVEGDTIVIAIPAAWVTVSSTGKTLAAAAVSPSAIRVHVTVSQEPVYVFYQRSSLSNSCGQIGTATTLVPSLATFLSVDPSVIVFVSASQSPLNPQFCNVSLVVLTSTQMNAITARAALISAAPADLSSCCSVALVYDPEMPPSDLVLRAALGVAPVASPSTTSVAAQLTWVFTSLGVILIIILVVYVYRRHAAGGVFSGTSRVHVDDTVNLEDLKMVVEADDSQAELIRKRRLAEIQSKLRFHRDNKGSPSFSAVENGANESQSAVDIHDTAYAGQPSSARSAHVSSVPLVIQPAELPPLDDDDDIPIAPGSIEGIVTAAMNPSGTSSGFNQAPTNETARVMHYKRISRLDKPRFEML